MITIYQLSKIKIFFSNIFVIFLCKWVVIVDKLIVVHVYLKYINFIFLSEVDIR